MRRSRGRGDHGFNLARRTGELALAVAAGDRVGSEGSELELREGDGSRSAATSDLRARLSG